MTDLSATEIDQPASGISGEIRTAAEQAVEDTYWLKVAQRLPFGLTVKDSAGRILRANRKFCEQLGFSEQQLKGRPFDDITHPADTHDERKSFALLMAGQLEDDAFQITKRYFHADRQTMVAAILTVYGIRDNKKGGKMTRAVGCVQFPGNGIRAKIEERGTGSFDARPVIFLSEFYRDNKKSINGMVAGAATLLVGLMTWMTSVKFGQDKIHQEVEETKPTIQRIQAVEERQQQNQVILKQILDRLPPQT